MKRIVLSMLPCMLAIGCGIALAGPDSIDETAPVRTREAYANEPVPSVRVPAMVPTQSEPEPTVDAEPEAAEAPDASVTPATVVAPEPEPEPRTRPLSDMADTFLSLHNDARRDHGVPALVWSEDLAAGASAWAETLASEGCTLRHSNEPLGENLYSLWSSDGSVRGTPQDAMTWWLDEARHYEYDDLSCADGAVCGHYTQIVWRTTTMLGCAVTTCTDGNATRDLFVCRYAPQGNIPGRAPY